MQEKFQFCPQDGSVVTRGKVICFESNKSASDAKEMLKKIFVLQHKFIRFIMFLIIISTVGVQGVKIQYKYVHSHNIALRVRSIGKLRQWFLRAGYSQRSRPKEIGCN